MALSKRDEDKISLLLSKALDPIKSDLQQYGQTLYGVNKNNGMVKDVQDLKAAVDKIKFWAASVAGGVSVVIGVGKEVVKAMLSGKGS